VSVFSDDNSSKTTIAGAKEQVANCLLKFKECLTKHAKNNFNQPTKLASILLGQPDSQAEVDETHSMRKKKLKNRHVEIVKPCKLQLTLFLRLITTSQKRDGRKV